MAAAQQPVELGKRQRKAVTYNEATLAKAKASASNSSSNDDSDSDATLGGTDDSMEVSVEGEGGEKKVHAYSNPLEEAYCCR